MRTANPQSCLIPDIPGYPRGSPCTTCWSSQVHPLCQHSDSSWWGFHWKLPIFRWNFTFMGPCVNVFKHDQQDATLHNGIYYYKCSTCFRRFLHPSSGAQNCIHSFGYLSSFFSSLLLLWVDSGKKQKKLDKYPMLCMQFWAPDDRRRNSRKHAEHL
jgi:hypothetical protein